MTGEKLLIADTLGDAARALRLVGDDSDSWFVVSVRSRASIRGRTPQLIAFTPAALRSRKLPKVLAELEPALIAATASSSASPG